MSAEKLPRLISSLYRIVDELEMSFPRKFTLDGHLVGSIGEVVAAHFYDLELASQSTEALDAWTLDGTRRSVQIKLTQGKSVQIAKTEKIPDYLIVLRIDRRNGFDEVFNGEYPIHFLESKTVSKRLEWSVSLSSLRSLPKRNPLPSGDRMLDLNSLFRLGDRQ